MYYVEGLPSHTPIFTDPKMSPKNKAMERWTMPYCTGPDPRTSTQSMYRHVRLSPSGSLFSFAFIIYLLSPPTA